MSDDGMRCHDCGEEHSDWEKDGEHAVDDAHNVGIITRFECGRCGALTEVPRR